MIGEGSSHHFSFPLDDHLSANKNNKAKKHLSASNSYSLVGNSNIGNGHEDALIDINYYMEDEEFNEDQIDNGYNGDGGDIKIGFRKWLSKSSLEFDAHQSIANEGSNRPLKASLFRKLEIASSVH